MFLNVISENWPTLHFIHLWTNFISIYMSIYIFMYLSIHLLRGLCTVTVPEGQARGAEGRDDPLQDQGQGP